MLSVNVSTTCDIMILGDVAEEPQTTTHFLSSKAPGYPPGVELYAERRFFILRGDIMAGQPKKFGEDGKGLIKLYSDFCDEVIGNGFMTVPTETEFCRWLCKKGVSADRKTVYSTMNRYFPEIKKDFEKIRGDTIAQGAMLGKYKETMTIFALKHWCGWSDHSGGYTGDNDETAHSDIVKALRGTKNADK